MFVFDFVAWLLALFGREHHEIGRRGLSRFLTRWTLWGHRYGKGGKIFLHCFHRGDAETYNHDHPWSFLSLILWGGYWEITEGGRQWYGPLSLLRRPATWRHRVELPLGRRCWTIVWCGEREREWGFICPGSGWRHWRRHEASQATGGTGCEP